MSMSVTMEFVPATFSNRFSVSLNPAYTKTTFADKTQNDEEIPHTGIVPQTSNAVVLANLILSLETKNRADNPHLYR
jgi:hypothetical protein